MRKDELHTMNKIALEDYGRTLGVELDRRLSKSKLVEQILSVQGSVSDSVVIADSEAAPVVVKEDKYGLVRQGDSWSVSLGNREVYKTSSETVAKKWMENN